MHAEQLRSYTILVDFLGKALGPDYEITLHDLTAEDCPIVAIANARLSGKTVDNTPKEHVAFLLRQQEHASCDYQLHHTSRLINGKTVRSSCVYIRNEAGVPIALLCVNFDDSRFRALSDALLHLVHPHAFSEHTSDPVAPVLSLHRSEPVHEPFHNNVNSLMQSLFETCTAHLSIPTDRLNQQERTELITALNEAGMFRFKGAVQFVCEKLGCSQASIYRYLNKAKQVE